MRGSAAASSSRQREDALARGIELIEWTFDPLELKNAFFNIEKLGAIVRRLPGKSLRHHHQPLARRSAHGSLHRRMVDRFAARHADFAGARSRRAACPPSASPIRPTSRSAADSDRARKSSRQSRAFSSDAFARGLAVTGFERSRNRRHLPVGTMAMKLDRITLRQIRMPLVHFFETSFWRTYSARHRPGRSDFGDGLSGWGEVTAGENPFYNEEWTASAWPHPARLRGAARAGKTFESRRGRLPPHRAHPRP